MNIFNPQLKTTISRQTVLHIWNLVEDLGQVHEAHYENLAEAGEPTGDLLYWSILAVEEWLETLPIEAPGAAIHRSLERKSKVYPFPEGGRSPRSTTAVEEPSPQGTQQVYRVVASSFFRYAIYVEADSEDEALDIGSGVDTDHWDLEHDDWEVEYAEAAAEARPEQMLAPGAYKPR
ncbi:hypothetical protein NG895_02455 [Aeoliella sp. ICT_H6.2]|uniref:Uncharacterized protein n=1 Tax=Aeoliella straminimaris TaxID=2954799 RepID=A0A9X2F6M7_9BACT|nr:hypothetical protein [Aeoliella straminimaris]MCO6042759.1 hypothetical protein [Aeoliella straminimaris]